MRAPQIILLGMYLLSIGMALAKDGQPKEGNHSFVATVVAAGIVCGVLWWGGFWG